MSVVGEALARHLRATCLLPMSVDTEALGEALASTVAEVDDKARPAIPQFTIDLIKARTADLNAAREKLDHVEQLISDAQCNAYSHIAVSSLIEALR